MITEDPPPHPAGSRQFPSHPASPSVSQSNWKLIRRSWVFLLLTTCSYTVYNIHTIHYTLYTQSWVLLLLSTWPTLHTIQFTIQNTHNMNTKLGLLLNLMHTTHYTIHYAIYYTICIKSRVFITTWPTLQTKLPVLPQCGNWGGLLATCIYTELFPNIWSPGSGHCMKAIWHLYEFLIFSFKSLWDFCVSAFGLYHGQSSWTECLDKDLEYSRLLEY